MNADQTIAPPARGRDVAGSPRHAAKNRPVRVAAIGMGWWSDVLADAVVRSGKFEMAACFTRSEDKRGAFAGKYRCRAAASYQEILDDPEIDAIINTTPNDVHLETTRAAADAGKHVFLDKPIANTVTEARAITEACRKAGVVLALGYQRRRESQFRWIRQQIDQGALGKLVNAESNISRDRLGKIDLGSWRYTAAGMPGGVMLQIGIHYADVLEYLMGPIRAVSGSFVRLVLPGDNPDVASLIFEHESGALSTLNASYASASEFYLMNIYGKDATVFYDRHSGMRMLRRGSDSVTQIPFSSNDTFVEELEEFAAAVRGQATPEVGGEYATRSLAVVRAGVLSAQQGRRVEVAEVLAGDR
jgi:predicted dehydrogenase